MYQEITVEDISISTVDYGMFLSAMETKDILLRSQNSSASCIISI